MFALCLWAAADAVAGGTKKIDQALADWQAGDAEAFGDARAALDKAHGKAPDDPVLAVLEAELWVAAAAAGQAVDGDPAAVRALAALEAVRAAEVQGELRARAEPLAARLAGLLVAELTNQVEGKQWEDARVTVERCAKALPLADAAGQQDAERGTTFERLATRVAVQRGDVADARIHYAALHEASGQWDVALAAKVARKVAEVEAPSEALAFLGPILDAQPADEALLRGWVELATKAGQPEQARARLDAVRESLVTSKSGAVLLGELYGALGLRDEERAAYESLLALEPGNIPANAALARFWLGAARAARGPLDAEGAARRPTPEAKALLTRVAGDLEQAEQRVAVAAGADPSVLDLQLLWKEILEERLSLLTAGGATADKAAADAFLERIGARRLAISDLESKEGP